MMRILLIEDDRRLSSVLERALRDEGFDVDAAYDGIAGTKLLRAGTGDAVILDLGLPGRDGLELLQELREGGSTVRFNARVRPDTPARLSG